MKLGWPGRAVEKLHWVHAQKKSDWEGLEPETRNIWQRTAAATHGILTPGNVITLIGSILVAYGLLVFVSGNLYVGFLLLALGRIADIADGNVSHRTGTKSTVGAAVDAGADWTQLAITTPILFIQNALPLAAALLIALPKLVDTFSSIAAKVRHKRMNASREGKMGSGIIWLGLCLFMLASAQAGSLLTLITSAAWITTIAGSIIHAPASLEYFRTGFLNHTQK